MSAGNRRPVISNSPAASSDGDSARALAGTVAHILNNVLTAVLGYGALLAEQVADDPDASASAREIIAAGERAAALSNRLLLFSRRQVLSPRRVDLGHVIADLRPTFVEICGDAVRLETSVADRLPTIRVDVEQLREALIELARNAREAMTGEGIFQISVEAGGAGHVRISLTDTGCGISPELHGRIFEPFFTTRSRNQCDGMGLASVRGFVEQSGGSITVDSQPGNGTSFTIQLPTGDVPAQPLRAVPVRASRAGAGETVLIVDDAEAVRTLVAESLRRAGYHVVLANSAADALKIAASQSATVDLLLTDVLMPGTTGVDLARELRKDRPGLRVLYMSGYAGHPLVQSKIVKEGEHFLEKPFSRDALLRTVAGLLK